MAGVGADLWSAGVPPRMGGVVGCCDMDGASMRDSPTPYAWLPLRRERGVIPCPPAALHSTRWRWAGADLWSAGVPPRMGGAVFYVVIVKTVIPYCMKCRSKENATLTPSRSITEKLTASVKEKSLSL